MVLHLAEHLDVPLRDRNVMLTAAGFAPVYQESALDAPELASVRQAIEVILANHEPCPAFVIDGAWNLLEANAGVAAFLDLISPELLDPPMNVIRASLHPRGLSRYIVNFDEYAAHVIERLNRQLAATSDPGLEALLDEVIGLSGRVASDRRRCGAPAAGGGAPDALPARRRHRAALLLHDDGLRLAARRDDRGAGHRELLPRRRGDRGALPLTHERRRASRFARIGNVDGRRSEDEEWAVL